MHTTSKETLKTRKRHSVTPLDVLRHERVLDVPRQRRTINNQRLKTNNERPMTTTMITRTNNHNDKNVERNSENKKKKQ